MDPKDRDLLEFEQQQYCYSFSTPHHFLFKGQKLVKMFLGSSLLIMVKSQKQKKRNNLFLSLLLLLTKSQQQRKETSTNILQHFHSINQCPYILLFIFNLPKKK